MRVDIDTHTQNTKHKTQNTMHETSTALHFGDCIPQQLAEKEQVVASHACWHKQKHTHVHTLSSEMLLRRLKTLPRAAKRLLWMASLVNHIFVHLKRPNNCTADAVCISGMFTLNLLFFRDQDQRRDLSLVLLKGEKLLHRMHVETRTHKTQCTIHPPHCTLDTANQRLAEKEQVVASRVC